MVPIKSSIVTGSGLEPVTALCLLQSLSFSLDVRDLAGSKDTKVQLLCKTSLGFDFLVRFKLCIFIRNISEARCLLSQESDDFSEPYH